MPSEVKAYKCDWCTRCYRRICDTNRHEKACNNNPARRHCKTCVHGVIAIIGWRPDYNGNPVIEDTGPFCDYHEKPIHEKPYFIDCETYTNYGFEDEPHCASGTCLHYEYKGSAEWTSPEVEG